MGHTPSINPWMYRPHSNTGRSPESTSVQWECMEGSGGQGCFCGHLSVHVIPVIEEGNACWEWGSEGWHPLTALFETFCGSSALTRQMQKGAEPWWLCTYPSQTLLGCTCLRHGLEEGSRPSSAHLPLRQSAAEASKAKALYFSGSSQAVISGEVLRVPSAACSTRLPAAPDAASLEAGLCHPSRSTGPPGHLLSPSHTRVLYQGKELGVLGVAAGLQHSARSTDGVIQQCDDFLATQPRAPVRDAGGQRLTPITLPVKPPLQGGRRYLSRASRGAAGLEAASVPVPH